MRILSESHSKNLSKKKRFEKLIAQKCNNQAIKKLKKENIEEMEVEDVLMKYYDACVDSAIHS